MRSRLAKSLLGVLLLLALSLSAVPALANKPEDAAGKGPPASDGGAAQQAPEVHQVTLITGDIVTVTVAADGKKGFAVAPADPSQMGRHFMTEEANGNTYIFPDGIDLSKVDKELFNIDYLVDEQYYQQTSLPVLVSHSPGLPAQRVQSLENTVKGLGRETALHEEVAALSTRLAYPGIAAAYSGLLSQPEVSRIWLDKKVRVQLNDSVPLIGAPSWWAAGYNGTGEKIAILDTGIDSTHPALNDLDDNPATNDPKVVVNRNYTDDSGYNDLFGHGTHVAGIAAGTRAAGIAHSGSYIWFSGAANNLHNTLTRAFSLGANSTSLKFWTQYDLETGYDYGYLRVSTDNGSTWANLATYNGVSANRTGFTQLSYDLAAYAGRNILVRFEYNTDYSVVRRGWYVDDIEIPGVGFLDNAETGAANWTAAGWTRTQMAYQGVAPGAWLWNIKVLNQYGYGYDSWIINGINFASLGPDGVAGTGDEADVISMSLGGGATDGTDPLSQAVNLAVDRGVTVVVAAGNSGSNLSTVSTPGAAEKVITVGASAKDDTLAYFSSRGPTLGGKVKPDILAPGVDITSSLTTNPAAQINDPSGYGSLSGTSMATPHVAGAAALVRQQLLATGNVTPAGLSVPQYIKDSLMSSAKDLGYNVYEQGSGRLTLNTSNTSLLPQILVTPASLSLGQLSSANASTVGMLTVFNTGNVSHQISLSANLSDVFASTPSAYSANVSLSPMAFTLAPSTGVSVNVTIRLTSLPSSLFSGKITATVDNVTSVHGIFGFSKLRQVTVHKTDISGASAQGHPVWVLASSPSKGVNVFNGTTDSSGNATFYMPEGMYDLISPNWSHESNQTTIWTMSENFTVSGDRTLSVDERGTRVVDFNPNKSGLIPSGKVSMMMARANGWGWGSSWWYPQSFVTRVSPTSKFDAGFIYQAYPQADFARYGTGLLNTGEWLNLFYSVSRFTDNLTFAADYANLVHRTTSYGVALNGEMAYSAQYSYSQPTGWSWGFTYRQDVPQTRLEWLSPSPVNYYQHYYRYLSDNTNRWRFSTGSWASYPSGNATYITGFHPFTSGLDPYINLWGVNGINQLVIGSVISLDAAGNAFYNDSANASGHLKVTNNSANTVFEKDILDGFNELYDYTGTANLTIEVSAQTALALSRTSYTRLDFVADINRDYRPPKITNIIVPGIDATGTAPGGRIKVAVKVTDTQSAISSVRLHYSLTDNSTNLDAGAPVLENGSYVFDLGALQQTFVSIAIDATDQVGNHIRRMTDRAFYVASGMPQIRLDPTSVAVSMPPGANMTRRLNLGNTGNSTLTFSITDKKTIIPTAISESKAVVAVSPDAQPYQIVQEKASGLAGDAKMQSGGSIVKPALATIQSGIKVAILATYTGGYTNETNAAVDMANTLIANGIDAHVVRYTDIDTTAEINNYDVVILGTGGMYTADEASGYGIVQSKIRSFVEDSGRGVVGVGGVVYTSGPNHYTDYNAIFPVDVLTPYDFLWGYNVQITDPNHPVTSGVNAFGLNSSNLAEWAPGGVKQGSNVLGLYTQNNKEAIVTWTKNGNVAYLGPYYLCDESHYNTAALYTNANTVQLLVNAVRWAGRGGQGRWLDESPKTGTVLPGQSANIDLFINTSNLSLGNYSANISISHNGMDPNPFVVPVKLSVGSVVVSINAPDRVAAGGNFTATVDVNHVEGFDAANYDVSFNPAVLRLDSVTSGQLGNTGNYTVIPVAISNASANGTYTIVQNVPGFSGVSGTGYLSVLHFRAVGAMGSSSNISLSNGALSSNLAEEITASWQGELVHVSIMQGDANDDGKVNAVDITRVERIIAGLDAPTPGADANLDGNINAMDITKVERIIAKLDPPWAQPPPPGPPEIQWSKTFGGAADDWGRSVQPTSDGGYIIAGSINSSGAGGSDVYLLKTNSSGNMTWSKTFGGPGDDMGFSVQQTSDGGYVITGLTYSFGAGGSDVYLVKTDASGNVTWSKTFGGTNNDYGHSVQQTSDGGYIIAGQINAFGAGSGDVYLVKADSSGNMLWGKTFGGAYSDYAQSAQQTSDGGYIIAGFTESFGAQGWDVYLVKTDSSGNMVWSKTVGGAGTDFGWSVQQTSDGGYIIVGQTYAFIGASSSDVYLVKTDSSGNMIWSKTFGGTGQDIGYGVQQTPDGGYIIVGTITSFGAGGEDVYLVKTDSSGNMAWSKTFGGTNSDQGYSVQLTPDGGYIIAGFTYSFGAGNSDVYLVKLR